MTYDISNDALDRIAAQHSPDSPIHMLNLMRFRPDGGRETYFGEYLPAFRAIAASLGIEGIEAIWRGAAMAAIAGPEEERWDAILIVRYPSFAAFRAIVDSDDYRTKAAPHRRRAMLDWRLIAQVAMG